MGLNQNIIESVVDSVAELIALMALRSSQPSSLKGLGELLEQCVLIHLGDIGLGDEEIAALLDLKSPASVRTRRTKELGLEGGDIRRLIDLVETTSPPAEAVVVEEFARTFGKRDSEDIRRRGTARAEAIIGFLCGLGLLAREGPRANVMLTLALPDTNQRTVDFVWMLLHRSGPLALAAVAREIGEPEDVALAALQQLQNNGHAEKHESGWAVVHADQGDRATSWETSVIDHTESANHTMSTFLRSELPAGYRQDLPKDTGFGSAEFSLVGRDDGVLLAKVRDFWDSLNENQRPTPASGKTLRVYVGSFFDQIPR